MSFYSTLGNCVDLIQGTCTHLKNVLTCKNRNVANICRDTCDNCGPKPGTYISISENLKKVYQKRKHISNIIFKICVSLGIIRVSSYLQVISFYLFSIKVQCKWSVWTQWSKCSKSCGGGSQKRRRTIGRTAKHGGKRCDGSNTARQSCNVKKCPGMIFKYVFHLVWYYQS